MEASKCKGCSFRLQLKKPHGTFGPREDASPEIVNPDVRDKNSQRRGTLAHNPSTCACLRLVYTWSDPSPNTYSRRWNLGPSLLTCMLHSLPYHRGWWWLFVETSLPTMVMPRALRAPSLRSPHGAWEMGAALPPTLWLKTRSLSNAVYRCNAYGFSFQRATLEGMGRQWPLFFLSLSPQPSGFTQHVQKPQQCCPLQH